MHILNKKNIFIFNCENYQEIKSSEYELHKHNKQYLYLYVICLFTHKNNKN